MTEPALEVADHPVVVGADGSEPSLAAVDRAASEAGLRRLPLEIVHGLLLSEAALPTALPPDLPPMAPPPELDPARLRERAERMLHDAAARVRATHPDLPVITRLRDGHPAGVLVDASRQATLVVVGHRGTGGFAELLAGSVGLQVANHAACPVLVVRGEVGPDDPDRLAGPVVVGVDGSDGSRRAAEYALATAERYQATVLALYAWPPDTAWPPAVVAAGHPPPDIPDVVAETLADLTGRYPRVPVQPEVRRHTPAHEALVEASKNARLVVVGSRGRGGFRGLLLGSVSQAMIQHAHCPVVVVGPAAAPAGDGQPPVNHG